MERLYLDTSVFGGYFEPEFELWTKLLIDKIIKGNMKTTKTKKEKSAILQLRNIRDKIGLDIQDMTFEQLKKYIEERLTLHPTAVWQKAG